jgi:hypothetical protein
MKELEKSLWNLGYEYSEVAENIFLINDFLKEEEFLSINRIIDNSSEEDWSTHYMSGVVGLAERKYGRTDIDNLVKEGLIEITDHWIDKNLSLPFEISDNISKRIRKIFQFSSSLNFDGVGTIQRQYSGAPLIEHVDNHSDPLIEYAVIIYVNDDYVDGELFFSKLNLSIRPKKYSMIIFPSGENYLHGVRPPGDGPLRYVLPSFVKRNEKYETN